MNGSSPRMKGQLPPRWKPPSGWLPPAFAKAQRWTPTKAVSPATLFAPDSFTAKAGTLTRSLHTHCITFNVTHDPVENRFKALEAGPIYDNARKLTALYREHLSQSLHALGYETYRDRYQAPQIRGVDVAVMRQFSKRSKQRDTWVAVEAAGVRAATDQRRNCPGCPRAPRTKQKRVDADNTAQGAAWNNFFRETLAA